jgi:hypothetical protein
MLLPDLYSLEGILNTDWQSLFLNHKYIFFCQCYFFVRVLLFFRSTCSNKLLIKQHLFNPM